MFSFYLSSCLGHETAKGSFGFRSKLTPAHLSQWKFHAAFFNVERQTRKRQITQLKYAQWKFHAAFFNAERQTGKLQITI